MWRIVWGYPLSNLASSIGSAVKNITEHNKGLVRAVDTEANILARTGDPIGSVALASDTNKLYIYLGSAWGSIDIVN